MTTRFTEKDPLDIVTVEFDFSEQAVAVSAPSVAVVVVSGVDPSPGSILLGGATIVGARVLQRVQAGVSGVTYSLVCAAFNGVERYTIDALLPVLTRPVQVAAPTRYLTAAQFEQKFGRRELEDLTQGGTEYAQAENDAAGIVDGYIASRYTLPLIVVPPMVLGWVADISRFRLWDEHAPEEVRRRYEDAIAQLRDLAKGLISLPPGADGAAPTAGNSYDGYANDRVFTQETLSGY